MDSLWACTIFVLFFFLDLNTERHIAEKVERELELAVVDFEKALELDPDSRSSSTGIQLAQNLLMNLIGIDIRAQPREDLDEIIREMTELT